ncbi:ubiquitinyl hydrolase [Linderina pennispora]|uniref:ubiquitinyl hydrolase 1 n=1 Tax=Linderina pennispora TaxID=61395 RepID=A0A1Y1W675_9FUNG|nr:ubiquitinyl hydrolase [Linderina pennispora]ORX68746.1 ubiquitinyl hydrolase [Linderina pennispora]
MSLCEHVLTAQLSPPSSTTPVYKEECTQCFDTYDMAAGINVCLTCFNGGCPQHGPQHALRTGHNLAVNIRRTKKQAADSGDERPAKLTKLEITEEVEEYDFTTTVHCWACSGSEVDGQLENIAPAVQAVVRAAEASKQSEIKAWAEEVTGCAHFDKLQQQPLEGFSLEALHKCGLCDKAENLWLCLECGHVGCGRRQYDGSGGNDHAVGHYQQTGHAVSVKLGTITPEGTADAYCYKCDENRLDPELAQHLQKFGISVAAQLKTEKSIAELQLEQNLKFDFSMTTADGAQLTPQCVFAIDAFRDRYFPTAADHFLACGQPRPAQCLSCQTHKLAHGLTPRGQTFKAAVARDHYEFASMRQQDAFEFWLFLMKQVNVMERTGGPDPSRVFDFVTEERLQCMACKKVRYSEQPASSVTLPVEKRETTDGPGAGHLAGTVDGYRCPECRRPTTAQKSTRFKTFPKVLAVQARRFELVNWVPQKLDIPVQEPLPDEEEEPQAEEAAPSDQDIAQLESMGFPRVRCIKALKSTGDVEAALNWIFEHMDDPDIDEQPASAQAADPASVEMLMAMGFARDRVERALKDTGGDAERALDRLLTAPEEQAGGGEGLDDVTSDFELTAFVSHKGSSVHCGHYIASARHGLGAAAKWHLFNDEKVVEQPEPQPEQGYVYFFTRTD